MQDKHTGFVINRNVVAGTCPLQELPLHLLYKISRQLDLNSQRDLFMCSSQLYSRWQVHIPDHHQWQFVRQGLDVLDKAANDSHQSTRGQIKLHFEARPPCFIGCVRSGVSSTFRLYSPSQNTKSTLEWSNMTQDKLWHRLTGSPDLAFANFLCEVESPGHEPKSDQLKVVAKQCFNFLCTSKGFLTFCMEGLRESDSEEQEDDEGQGTTCHALNVCHGREHWEIDGETCTVNPPKLDFDNMPVEVTRIQAQFVSQGRPNVAPDTIFNPYSQVVHDFAYKENVDVEAWAEEQHEAANDWYAHMDDFDDMDALDDLDDVDVAQLLGAMQA